MAFAGEAAIAPSSLADADAGAPIGAVQKLVLRAVSADGKSVETVVALTDDWAVPTSYAAHNSTASTHSPRVPLVTQTGS